MHISWLNLGCISSKKVNFNLILKYFLFVLHILIPVFLGKKIILIGFDPELNWLVIIPPKLEKYSIIPIHYTVFNSLSKKIFQNQMVFFLYDNVSFNLWGKKKIFSIVLSLYPWIWPHKLIKINVSFKGTILIYIYA